MPARWHSNAFKDIQTNSKRCRSNKSAPSPQKWPCLNDQNRWHAARSDGPATGQACSGANKSVLNYPQTILDRFATLCLGSAPVERCTLTIGQRCCVPTWNRQQTNTESRMPSDFSEFNPLESRSRVDKRVHTKTSLWSAVI